MKALGLMEFRGYVPAVEGLDIALKAANVELLRASRDGGGLVSVLVTGDVGAVKAAISAVLGTVSSGELLASSVIPRPASDTAQMLEGMPRSPIAPRPSPKVLPEEPPVSPAEQPAAELVPVPVSTAPAVTPPPDNAHAHKEAAAEKDRLGTMTLKELRAAAASMHIEGWSAEKIKKASRLKLIAAIMREQEK